MRTFIAVDLPENITKQLTEIQESLKTNIAKQTISKQQHLTLKFLGEVKEEDIEKIKQSLNKVKFQEFESATSKIGVFPNENYIKVVWLGIDPEDQIMQLKQNIDAALKEFNFKDDHKFHPHITLSRVKFITDKEEFKKILATINSKKKIFQIKQFKLYSSTLTPKGPLYKELASFP